MAFDIGSVIAKIDADISGFQKGMNEAKQSANGFGTTLKGIGSGLADFGKQAAIFTGVVGAGIAVFGKQSIDAYNDSAAKLKQLEAVMKSTGGVAGVTTEQVIKLSKSLQTTTTFSDEAVLSAENLLLTFTNIGKETFPQATKTVLDMSVALGQDTKSSAIQLGKALQDPILGITALRRVGVNFSDKQKDVIEKLVNTGHSLEAQRLILKELNTEFGGSAAAAADTYAGKIEILKNKFNDFQETIGLVLTTVAAFLVTGNDTNGGLFDAINALIPDDATAQKITNFIISLREALVKIGNWIAANQDLVIAFLKGLAIAVGALMIIGTITMLLGLILNPLFLVGAAIAALYTAWETNFMGFRDITQAVVTEILNFFNNYLMPLIQIFVGWWKEHWDTISLILLGAWNIIKGIVQLAWSIVYGIIKVGIDLLTGKWGQAWEDIKDLVSGAWNGIKNIFIGALQFIGGWAGTVFHDLVQPFKDAWNAISDLVNKIKNALDFTKRHSPSVVDIVKNGVSKVNDALGDLAFGGTINASAAGAAVSNGGNQNSTVVVRVDMAGAFIADAYGANQMAELVGDGIIKRLQGNARI